MKLSWRQTAIALLLVSILAGWAWGLCWVLGAEWFSIFHALAGAGFLTYFLHYCQESTWMGHRLGARRVRSRSLDRVYRASDLARKANLYVTQPMSGVNAFMISTAGEDSIFVTPEIYRTDARLQEPILAHEMAHIQHNDSLVIGFISVFEQMIGNLG